MVFRNLLEFYTFAIFIVSFILGILSIVFMFKHFRKYLHEGLLILTIANIFTGFAPFAHVGHLIFHDKRYEPTITTISAVMISLLITGSYLHLIGFNRLTEIKSSRRIISLSPIYLLGMILNAVVIKHEYRNDTWYVVYQPEYAFYFFALCVIIIQVDLYVQFYSLIRYTKIPRVKHIFVLSCVCFLSLVPLLVLRKFFLIPQNIFLLPMSTFYLLFTILVTFYPLVFFSSTASPYFLIIFDSHSNQILWQYTFLEPNNEQRSEQVLGQMIELYEGLNDKMFRIDISQIQTRTFQYYFENTNKFRFLLVLNKSSNSFKLLLYELANSIENGLETSISKSNDYDNQISYENIRQAIDKTFVHQLERLKLVRQDIDKSFSRDIIRYIEKNQSLKLVLHPTRLSIIQILNDNNTMLRSELQNLLKSNSGKLQRHLEVLKEANYLGEDIVFVENRPRKTIFITQQGRMEYASFKNHMREITKSYQFV